MLDEIVIQQLSLFINYIKFDCFALNQILFMFCFVIL